MSNTTSNPLVFIPDASFTSGIDHVQIIGQQNGSSFCVDEIDIEYNNPQPINRARLIASPNPVSNRATLLYEFINVDKVENAKIEIYNTLGHLKDWRKITVLKGEAFFDLSTYSSGQYIVVLKHNGKIAKQLILIKE